MEVETDEDPMPDTVFDYQQMLVDQARKMAEQHRHTTIDDIVAEAMPRAAGLCIPPSCYKHNVPTNASFMQPIGTILEFKKMQHAQAAQSMQWEHDENDPNRTDLSFLQMLHVVEQNARMDTEAGLSSDNLKPSGECVRKRDISLVRAFKEGRHQSKCTNKWCAFAEVWATKEDATEYPDLCGEAYRTQEEVRQGRQLDNYCVLCIIKAAHVTADNNLGATQKNEFRVRVDEPGEFYRQDTIYNMPGIIGHFLRYDPSQWEACIKDDYPALHLRVPDFQ